MNVYSTQQIKNAEKQMLAKGITESDMVSVASDCINAFLSTLDGDIVMLVGSGNNGSDALCACSKSPRNITVYATEKANALNSELREKISKKTVIRPLSEFSSAPNGSIIVDALCGTGLNRALSSEYENAIRMANAIQNVTRVAIDIPTGLDDVGAKTSSVVFIADYTIVLGGMKYANVLNDAPDYCGKTVPFSIGLPLDKSAFIIGQNDAQLEKRKSNSHKGNFGKVTVVGGCKNYIGAPAFSALSAYTVGAGTVSLCVCESLFSHYVQYGFSGISFEFMPDENGYCAFSKTVAERIAKTSTTIVLGAGIGLTSAVKDYLEYFIKSFTGTLIIDADAITTLSQNLGLLKAERKAKIILTPHVGEFNRLTKWNKTVEEVIAFAKEYNVAIAVKSNATIITDGTQIAINVTGTPALAKGGSGDVLAGTVSAFCANYTPFDALVRACYYLGKAGEWVSENKNERTLSPMQIINAFEHVLKN